MSHLPHFDTIPNLVYGISQAEDGNMSFLYGKRDEVVQNRQKFIERFSVNPNQVAVTQLLHKADIIEVTEKDRGRGFSEPETLLSGDVLVTAKSDTFLMFVVADCLALFVAEPVKGIVALAHAGWRGVDQQVPRRTIEYMVQNHGCDPANLLVGMSPACQKESSCFDNLEQVKTEQDRQRWERYIQGTDGRFCVDWVQFAYDQLLAAGIPASNIERSIIDTRNDKRYFSHRRSAEEQLPEARFACFLGLRS